MKAKIEWYQEVLELEPGSKVFFPLARLLGQAGQPDEAIRVLRQGLARHPEYIEARLLLVQLLQESGDTDQCADELEEITSVFAEYPGFWEAWSEHSPSDDVACALSFLSAAFRSPGLSLRDVFAAGLCGLNAAEPAPHRAPAPKGKKKPAAETPEPPAAVPVPELVTLAAAMRLPADERDASPAPLPPHEEEHDEPSVRTRTMAEVLAEQGDIQGAADIYSEILANTAPGAEADKLRKRLADLTARLGLALESEPDPEEAESDPAALQSDPIPAVAEEPGAPEAQAEVGETASAAPDTPADSVPAAENPMRDMLEELARRLDARAQA